MPRTKVDREASEGESGARPYQVNVLDRAIGILDAFVQLGPNLSLSEIASQTGLHLSTCLRLLSNLRHHGFIIKDEESGRYQLGYRLLTLAEIARDHSGLVQASVPTMRELSRLCNETVVLSIRSGDYRVDLEQVIGNQSVVRVLTLGNEKPLYAGAASRVLMSGLSPRELDAYLRRHPLVKLATQTITDEAELRASLDEIRKNGFAESVREQFDDSGGGVVAAIHSSRGDVIAALGVSVPQFRFSETLRATIRPAVLAAAQRIGQSLAGSL